MSNEKWSPWIEWSGGECPLDFDTTCEVKTVGDIQHRGALPADHWTWRHSEKHEESNIIAYRYRIEPGPTKAAEGMHPDLRWLAKNLTEWDSEPVNGLIEACTHVRVGESPGGQIIPIFGFGKTDKYAWFNEPQWLQARKDLGLEPSYITQEEEADYHKAEGLRKVEYSPYFKDVRHIDKLDVYRTIDLFGCERHGHPISHAVKKLLLSGVRTGGKDVEKDVDEAIDSLLRWKEMREEDKR